jgi:ribosomal RNA-processing protein 9
MVRPGAAGKRGTAAGGARKRKARDDFFEADDEEAEFLGSGDEGARVAGGGASSSGEDEAERAETADEKRLRLAKEILAQARALGGADDGAAADRLRDDAADAAGRLRRQIAARLRVPPLPPLSAGTRLPPGARLLGGHRLAVTAVALTPDDAVVYSVSKCGAVVRHDVETGARTRLGAPAPGGAARPAGPEWVAPAARQGACGALLAVAVSSDGRHLAVGGGDALVHLYDARSGAHVRAFPGHKGPVTALAFREGASTLFSGSLDRAVKIWELDDMAYVDTLFGHQAGVLSLAAGRAERALSSGGDRTVRVWKVPEESQLVFRGACPTIECARYLSGSEWVTGAADGSVALWSAAKKKPIFVARRAHVDPAAADATDARGAGGVGGAACAWVGAVATCRGADLVASGAGDGALRLWRAAAPGGGPPRSLEPLGALPVRGFVNALALARSGRFLVAGLGQEPRMGRWLRDGAARNGVLVAPLDLAGEDAAEEEESGSEGGSGDESD